MTQIKFLPYTRAFKLLAERIGATPADMAGWVFLSKKDGGLDAYTNANELEKPPRFYFSIFLGEHNYMGHLAACWFLEDDVLRLSPSAEERFISGAQLLERWKDSVPGISAADLIRGKIRESLLLDIHPLMGNTQASYPDQADFPPIEDALFVIAHVEAIEKEDLMPTTVTAYPTPTHIRGAPNPPARKDDWFFAIEDAIKELVVNLRRLPTENETWTKLRDEPPKAYGITKKLHRRELTLFIDEKPLTRGAFKDRWKRYVPNSNQ